MLQQLSAKTNKRLQERKKTTPFKRGIDAGEWRQKRFQLERQLRKSKRTQNVNKNRNSSFALEEILSDYEIRLTKNNAMLEKKIKQNKDNQLYSIPIHAPPIHRKSVNEEYLKKIEGAKVQLHNLKYVLDSLKNYGEKICIMYDTYERDRQQYLL